MDLRAILMIAALVIATIFWMVVFIIFYHLTRFGIGTLPKKFSAAFLAGSVALFLWNASTYFSLDLVPLIKLL